MQYQKHAPILLNEFPKEHEHARHLDERLARRLLELANDQQFEEVTWKSRRNASIRSGWSLPKQYYGSFYSQGVQCRVRPAHLLD